MVECIVNFSVALMVPVCWAAAVMNKKIKAELGSILLLNVVINSFINRELDVVTVVA
jgi:hypothetical protein